jgi:hypothetical protein
MGRCKLLFFVLMVHIERSYQPACFALLQWQIDASPLEKRLVIGIRKRSGDTFRINFNAQDFLRWLHTSKTDSGFKRRVRVKTITVVNKK